MYVVIYLISIKLVVVVKNMIINMDLIIFKTISTDWHVLVWWPIILTFTFPDKAPLKQYTSSFKGALSRNSAKLEN